MTSVVRRLTFRSRLLVVTIGGPWLCGCSLFSWLGWGGGQASSPDTADAPSPSATAAFLFDQHAGAPPSVEVIDLAFDVARIDLPVKDVRHSLKIWNHVDELRIDSEAAARLVRNGLRVGVASPDAWPAIRAIVEAAEADVRQDRFLAQRGMPLTIALASIDEAETIFTYASDGRLVGKTFPAGDKLLTIDYVFHPELGGSTDLTLSVEIRRDYGTMDWKKEADIIRQVPAYDRHVFTDLSTSVTQHGDESLIVGPSDQAGNEYLLGSRFLCFERSGQRYETVLCITPRPIRTPGDSRKP